MFWLLIFGLLAFWAGHWSAQRALPPTTRLLDRVDRTIDDAERKMIQAWVRKQDPLGPDDSPRRVIDQ